MATFTDKARSALIWAGFVSVAVLALPPMLLGYPLVLVDPNRAFADWYFRRLGRALMGVNPLWKVEVSGRERLSQGGPFVLVVNHQSLADLLLMGFLGHPTKYIGKESLFRIPVLGWALRIAGEVPVDRKDKASGTRALQELGGWLRRDVSVALFPEGTRSDDGSLGAFKLGAFALAVEHGRPLVPVVISGARALLPKKSFVFEREARVRLEVLEPIPTVGLTRDDVPALAERVRASMLETLTGREAQP